MAQALSYLQHLLAADAQFAGRIASILKDEDYSPPGESAMDMAWKYVEDVAKEPGLAEAYQSAIIGGIDDPASRDDVITDGQLLSAVVSVLGPPG